MVNEKNEEKKTKKPVNTVFVYEAGGNEGLLKLSTVKGTVQTKFVFRLENYRTFKKVGG